MPKLIVPADVAGPILVLEDPLSFWGGVDVATGLIVDEYHPQRGHTVAGQVLMMRGSRGSCTGSGVLLELAQRDLAPKALVFQAEETILTLGALVAERLFGHRIAVLRVTPEEYDQLAGQVRMDLTAGRLVAGALEFSLDPIAATSLALDERDQAFLNGDFGDAARFAMEIITTMAATQGARQLIDVSRVHIDACIYAGKAFLDFAQAMVARGGRVRVPTTMNAISVDRLNWRDQGVPEGFGVPASQLADAYIAMGALPSFTCAPYLLDDAPGLGEDIAWAESNAVIYANSILGARTVKHADFMDLCVALTGRAARVGVYLEQQRRASRCITVTAPAAIDDAFWPMLGWLAGRAAPDRIPLLRGLEALAPSTDDLKALCAAFGTTSAAPMLHIAGITPEADQAPTEDADHVEIMPREFLDLWRQFNGACDKVDLVALGSPHFSAAECASFAGLMNSAQVHPQVTVIITVGRGTLTAIGANGVKARLEKAGVKVISDLCWCSISEPVLPPAAEVLMTNSCKYAHYAPGLSGRAVHFGSLRQCAETAQSGRAPDRPPAWVEGPGAVDPCRH